MDSIKKFYKEKTKNLSLFEKFLVNTTLIILLIIILFKWFVHIRLTVMYNMKPEFRYRDYVVHEAGL